MTLPKEKTPGEKARESLPGVTIHGLQDAKRLMKAAEWHGKQNVKVASQHIACSYSLLALGCNTMALHYQTARGSSAGA